MRIKYNLEKNYFKNYNEANGAICLKRKLAEKPQAKVRSYLTVAYTYCLALLIFAIVLLFWSSYFEFTLFMEMASFLIGASIFLFFFYFIWLYACSSLEINSKKGEIVISEDGITDENSNGNKITFSYNNIKAIIITKNLIVFSLSMPFMFFIPNKNKTKIIKEIKKYSDVLIIDKS